MKYVTVADILTEDEMTRVQMLWRRLKNTGRFAAAVEQDIILPNLARVRSAVGDESCSSADLVRWVEAACREADRGAGRLWEMADDLCLVCGAYLGRGLRFMHLGLCDACAKAPKH